MLAPMPLVEPVTSAPLPGERVRDRRWRERADVVRRDRGEEFAHRLLQDRVNGIRRDLRERR